MIISLKLLIRGVLETLKPIHTGVITLSFSIELDGKPLLLKTYIGHRTRGSQVGTDQQAFSQPGSSHDNEMYYAGY